MGRSMFRHWLAVTSLALAVTAQSQYSENVKEHNKPEYDVGDMARLSCAIPEQYWGWEHEDKLLTDCEFVDPNGEIYAIGVSGNAGYGVNARVDCLCDIEEYHPMKACGVFVKDLTKEDNGIWLCKYIYNGKWIIKWGKTESLRPGNLFYNIPALGSEYKIKFNLLVTSATPGKRNTVLMFTADQGLSDDYDDYIKYGERIPAVYYEDGNIIISSSVDGDPTFDTRIPYTLGEWIALEICQHLSKKSQQLKYYIRLDGKKCVVTHVVKRKPCLYRNVGIWLGRPDSKMPQVEGQIKSLFYSTSDAANYGSCIIDFTPRPLPPDGCITCPGQTVPPLYCLSNSAVSFEECAANNNGEVPLRKDQLLQVLLFIGREFVITFELRVDTIDTANANKGYSILHLTTGGNGNANNVQKAGVHGFRMPAIWIINNKLHICSS